MTRVSPQTGSSGIVVREPAAASNAHEIPEDLAAVKGGDAVSVACRRASEWDRDATSD